MLVLLKISDNELKAWIVARNLWQLRKQIQDSENEEALAVLPELEAYPPQGRTILSNGLIVLNVRV